MLNLVQLLERLRETREFRARVTHWEELPPRQADYADFPPGLHPDLKEVLLQKGISKIL